MEGGEEGWGGVEKGGEGWRVRLSRIIEELISTFTKIQCFNREASYVLF